MLCARLTTVARPAMFDGKFRATAVLNASSNKRTCLPSYLLVLIVIFGPKISQTYLVCKKINEKLLQRLDLLSLVYMLVPNLVLVFGSDARSGELVVQPKSHSPQSLPLKLPLSMAE